MSLKRFNVNWVLTLSNAIARDALASRKRFLARKVSTQA
jgi:hypothetical protein